MYGDGINWAACTIIYLLGQRNRFDAFSFTNHTIAVEDASSSRTTEPQLAQFLRNAVYDREINSEIFSILETYLDIPSFNADLGLGVPSTLTLNYFLQIKAGDSVETPAPAPVQRTAVPAAPRAPAAAPAAPEAPAPEIPEDDEEEEEEEPPPEEEEEEEMEPPPEEEEEEEEPELPPDDDDDDAPPPSLPRRGYEEEEEDDEEPPPPPRGYDIDVEEDEDEDAPPPPLPSRR